MFDTLYTQIGAIFVVAIAAFIFLKGDEPERFAMGAYLLAWLGSMLFHSNTGLYGWQPGVFALDMGMLVMFLALGWKSRKSWPIWAAALQLLAVMGHLLPLIDYRPPAFSFLTVVVLANYGTLIAMAVGAFWSWQERKAAGLE